MRKILVTLVLCSFMARLLLVWNSCWAVSQDLVAARACLGAPRPELREASRHIDRARSTARTLGLSLRSCLNLTGTRIDLPAEPTPPKVLLPLFDEAARTSGVERELLLAIVRTESDFHPDAQSFCGAQGLMLLMPEVAKEFGCRDPYDPRENLLAGSAYQAQMARRFGDLSLGLTAAFAGPGCVEKYQDLPPYGEVEEYLSKVMLSYLSYSLS